jgi:dTDP-4-dehydrorhamnose reductase
VKLAVLGAGGLLGRHVVDELRAGGHEVNARDRRGCDIAQLDEVRRAVEGAQIIINCAAFTNVDGAETDEAGAYRTNALGAENVARAASESAARLVHISTDFVFDGAQREPYDEFAVPNPLSIYARSKWAGEELARARCHTLFLVRVQGLYGRGGANFSSKLRELVLQRKPLRLDGERQVQPTWARAAARQLVALAPTDAFGTYHVSCKGAATWAEFATHIADRLAVAPAWQVVKTDELKVPARRPPNCLFRHRMLDMRGLNLMPTWQDALDEYLAEDRP